MTDAPERSWRQLENGRVVHRFEWVVLAATLALIPVLVIETDVKSSSWQNIANAANWIIWTVFLAELVFILTVAPRKTAALRAHWLDVALVVVTVPAFGRFLSSLRFVRLARLLRLFRLSVILSRAVQAERALSNGDVFRLVALVTVFLVVVGGAAEATVDTHDFPTLWDGIWWSIVTVTTVGYGDLYPKTVDGRIIGIIVMFVGIGFLAVLTAAIASRFVKSEREGEFDAMHAALTRIEAELADLKRNTARVE